MIENICRFHHPLLANVAVMHATSLVRNRCEPTLNGNPPAFSVRQKWSYAAIANFIAGVIPPSAMLGRSWLYVHSQR
ncbi:hypothetical protein QT428_22475, partial [Xanthomonas citri pv. citri]